MITFGALSGFIGNIPKMILVQIFHQLGWIKYTFAHIGAGLLVSKKFVTHPLALVTGQISDYIVAMFIGILILFLIRLTGSDKPILKGMLIGAFAFVFFYGLLMVPALADTPLNTPLPNFLILIPHVIYGGICGGVIKHYDNYEQPIS